MGKQVYFSELSKERKQQMREEIFQFCSVPRTHQEVALEFNLSGISASAILSNMVLHDRLVFQVHSGGTYAQRA